MTTITYYITFMRLMSKSLAEQLRKMRSRRNGFTQGRPTMWFLALAALTADLKPASWLLDQPESAVERFFDGGTGIWPASFGILILCAGFFGLVSLADLEGSDWLYYSIEGGFGSYLLKRTFSLT